jgi:hypothetical protein
MPFDLHESFQTNLENFEMSDKFKELFNKFNKNEEDCNGCGELKSPCCGSKVSLIRGTLPLHVKCIFCGKDFGLKELVNLL